MYSVLRGAVWTFVMYADKYMFIGSVLSALINCAVLASYRVRYFPVALLPLSQNFYKCAFIDSRPVPIWLRCIFALVGLMAFAYVEPLTVIAYMCIRVFVNYLYGKDMYDEGIAFALIFPYRWFVQVKDFIERGRS